MAAVLLAVSSPASARTLTWSLVPSPSPRHGFLLELDGMSCVSPSACTAVGWYQTHGDCGYKTLVESWDRTRWTVVPSPNPGHGAYTQLDGVSCVSPTGSPVTSGGHRAGPRG